MTDQRYRSIKVKDVVTNLFPISSSSAQGQHKTHSILSRIVRFFQMRKTAFDYWMMSLHRLILAGIIKRLEVILYDLTLGRQQLFYYNRSPLPDPDLFELEQVFTLLKTKAMNIKRPRHIRQLYWSFKRAQYKYHQQLSLFDH